MNKLIIKLLQKSLNKKYLCIHAATFANLLKIILSAKQNQPSFKNEIMILHILEPERNLVKKRYITKNKYHHK